MPKRWQAPDNLSRIAFGVSGPHATRLVSRSTTHDLIMAAFDGGITAFDTGPSYGAGEAELRLGAALQDLDREKVFISTKAGLNEQKMRDFTVEGLKASLDRSLERLDCGYLDLLILHGPSINEMTPQLANMLRAEQTSGRVRLLGVAGRDDSIFAALDFGVFDILMAPLHGLLHKTEINRLEAAKKNGLGIFAIEVLTGASAGLRWPKNRADLWYCARALRHNKLSAPQLGAQQAITFALDHPLADVVMVSTTRQAHLRDALHALDETHPNT